MSSPEEHHNSLTLQKILPDEQQYIAVCLLKVVNHPANSSGLQ